MGSVASLRALRREAAAAGLNPKPKLVGPRPQLAEGPTWDKRVKAWTLPFPGKLAKGGGTAAGEGAGGAPEAQQQQQQQQQQGSTLYPNWLAPEPSLLRALPTISECKHGQYHCW
jgi:hypothetical protein